MKSKVHKDLKILKGVPIKGRRAPRGKFMLSLNNLEVGDSLLVPCSSKEYPKVQNHVRSIVSRSYNMFPEYFGKKRFTVKRVDDGLCVWRVK